MIGYEVPYDYTQWGGDKGVNIYGAAWHTVDAAATPIDATEMITTGNINVSITDGVYTITVDNNEIYAQYVGEIPALLAPAVPADPWELTGDVVLIETEGVSMTMADDTANNGTQGGDALSGVTLWFVELKNAAGDVIAWFDLVTKAGSTSLAGEYKVVSYPDEVGEAGNGWDYSQWGPDLIGGTILFDKANGKSYNMADGGANIKITEDRGQTTIIVKGKSDAGVKVAAKYVFGELKEDEGGEGEGGACGCDCDGCKDCTGGGEGSGEDAFDGTLLTQFVSFTDYNGNGTKLVGIELASPTLNVTVEEMKWGDYTWNQTVIKGSGEHLKIEFYSEDGKLAAGTYTASKENSPKAGEFGIGYDYSETAVYGSTWNVYADDKVASSQKITDGTAIVEVSGDVYTITLNSSVANAKFTGKLSK